MDGLESWPVGGPTNPPPPDVPQEVVKPSGLQQGTGGVATATIVPDVVLRLQSQNQTLRMQVAKLEIENARLRLMNETTTESPPPAPQPPARGRECPADQSDDVIIKVDPLVAAELRDLRVRVRQAEEAVRILKESATVTAFTSDGPLGRKLLAKCRKLMTENAQLSDALLTSRVAALEQTNQLAAERDQALILQLKAISSYTVDLELQCAELNRKYQRLEAHNQSLKVELHQARSVSVPPYKGRGGRDRSSSFESRGGERRRRGSGRRD